MYHVILIPWIRDGLCSLRIPVPRPALLVCTSSAVLLLYLRTPYEMSMYHLFLSVQGNSTGRLAKGDREKLVALIVEPSVGAYPHTFHPHHREPCSLS